MLIPKAHLVKMDPDFNTPPEGTSPANGQDPKRLGNQGAQNPPVKWYEILVIVISVLLLVGLVVVIFYLRSRKIKKRQQDVPTDANDTSVVGGCVHEGLELGSKTEEHKNHHRAVTPAPDYDHQQPSPTPRDFTSEGVDNPDAVWRYWREQHQGNRELSLSLGNVLLGFLRPSSPHGPCYCEGRHCLGGSDNGDRALEDATRGVHPSI